MGTETSQNISYTYDGSLLTQSQWTGAISGSVTWTYDNNYRTTSQSVNGGNTVTFTYDTDDLLAGAGAMMLTRDSANGFLTGTTLGSVTYTMTYTGFGEVASYQASTSGTALLSEHYTRDSLGRISQKIETLDGVTTTYGYIYDPAGRLTQVTQNGSTTTTYTYDANSNRLSKTSPTGTQTGTHDDQDRLLSYNGATYSYTANGELNSRTVGSQVTTYSYDALGNLRGVTLPNGDQLGYVIDGENRRIGKTVNGTLVQGFLYENQLDPVAELDGNGNLVSRFVYCGCGTGNIPQYMIKGGVTYQIISDHLGSPRLVVDSTTGAIVQRMDYDEFGTVILDTNPGFQPFGFAGGLYDQHTQLTRFGVRDYDAQTGRWTAKDPIQFEGGSLNLYGYVFDPVNFNDPTGLVGELLSKLNALGGISTLQRLRDGKAIKQLRSAFRQLCHVAKKFMGPYDDLKKALEGSGFDSHHIFQDAPMKQALGNAYSKGAGFAIALIGPKKMGKGSPHGGASGYQTSHGAVLGEVEYGALVAAGCSPKDAREIVKAAADWNKRKGWN